jgi:Ca2+-transporting ATPase
MSDIILGQFLLILSVIFLAAYFLAGIFEKFKIPGILAALFVGMAAHYTHINVVLNENIYKNLFESLANIGVLFLLFFIGLEIDVKEMKEQSDDIILATVLNTAMPFVLGFFAMLYLGYGWIVAFVIALTRMPTAEAVIVPILDEFDLIKTKVGNYIVGAGVLDDIIEVFLVALVSVWIGEKSGAISSNKEITAISINIAIFISFAWIITKWVIRPLSSWLKLEAQNLIFLMIITLFSFGGFAEYSDLGLVVGAIVAGIIMHPVFNLQNSDVQSTQNCIKAVSYGFFGIIFFLWIGLSVDLSGILKAPKLAIILFLAAFLGKLMGIFMMVPMKKLTSKEAWIIGIGLNARLTTEIIVAKLLLDAKLIDLQLFSALVAASSVSTIVVPIVFAVLVAKWKTSLIPHYINKGDN